MVVFTNISLNILIDILGLYLKLVSDMIFLYMG